MCKDIEIPSSSSLSELDKGSSQFTEGDLVCPHESRLGTKDGSETLKFWV